MSGPGERERLIDSEEPPRYSATAKPKTANTLHEPVNGGVVHADNDERNVGETFDEIGGKRRQLGLTSAVFLIVNRIIGTGIYATPSAILQSCGSVGLSLIIWLLGALIAAAGTAVFIELGTGLPRNGGEKNYLEFIYRRPKFLISYVYAMLVVLIGWSAASTVLLGEYVVHAFGISVTRWNSRLVGAVALTVSFLLHGTRLKLGLRVQNALGIFTLLVMAFIVLAGLVLFIFPDFLSVERTDNLQWTNLWTGTRMEPNAFVTAIYNVIWCFNGYSNANYALSEVRDPVRTIKRAAPLALCSVTLVYMLVNLSYFAAVTKSDILHGGRVVAALFFRNVLGPHAERAVSLIIALSLFGNMLAMQFTQGRVIQELGREGILPYSAWFASNRPFNTPLTGLSLQWAVSLFTAILPPPGDAFNFVLQRDSYVTVIINVAVSAGLLFLHTRRARKYGYSWLPPFSAWTTAVIFFFLSNIFLAVVPFIPPAPGRTVYEHIPYFFHVIVALGIALSGAVCYYVRCVYLPRRGGYELVRELEPQDDGVSRNVFRKIHLG